MAKCGPAGVPFVLAWILGGAHPLCRQFVSIVLLTALFTIASGRPHSQRVRRMAAREGARATASNEAHRAAYSRRTLAFEVNEGQTDDRVSFLARASRHVVLLTDDEAVVSLASPSRRPATAEAVRMRFVGARAGAETVGVDALPGKVNYIIGNDPARWRTDVPTFARVQRKDIYPGIDVVYYGTQEQLEYDFVVSPSGKVDDIRLQFDGIEHSELNAAGDLVLRTRSGELRHRRPIVYQEVGGARTPIDGRYLLRESGEVGFEVGSYDSSKPLVIDPVLSYSTYLGSAGTDYANDIAVDGQGTPTSRICTIWISPARWPADWLRWQLRRVHHEAESDWRPRIFDLPWEVAIKKGASASRSTRRGTSTSPATPSRRTSLS